MIIEFLINNNHNRHFIPGRAAGVKPGDALRLVREPSNAYDSNKVRIEGAAGEIIGGIPREGSARIAKEMDSGWKAAALLMKPEPYSHEALFVIAANVDAPAFEDLIALRRSEGASAQLQRGLSLIKIPDYVEEGIEWIGFAARAGHEEAKAVLQSLFYDLTPRYLKTGRKGESTVGRWSLVYWCDLLANVGYPDAQFVLAQLRLQGTHHREHFNRAVILLRAAATLWHKGAQGHLDFLGRGGELPDEILLLTGIKRRRESVEKYLDALGALPADFPEGQFALGCYLLNDLRNAQESIGLIGTAAKAGLREAVEYLRKLYLDNSVHLKKRSELSWCEIFADAGQPEACFDLAQFYFLGIEVRKDIDRGIALLRSAALKGHLKSQQRLAFLYEVGDGVTKDTQQAEYWRMMSECRSTTKPSS